MGTASGDTAAPCTDNAVHLEAYLIAQADAVRAARELRVALAAAWMPTRATRPYLSLSAALKRLDGVADDLRTTSAATLHNGAEASA